MFFDLHAVLYGTREERIFFDLQTIYYEKDWQQYNTGSISFQLYRMIFAANCYTRTLESLT